MIKSLSIRNYAIIEELEINFSNGLTIITGETGAGKSILLGALGLIMGKRADTKALYDESQKCIVEGTFDVSNYDLKAFFAENDLDYDDELLVRREITPSGKSRAFLNDTPVNLKILQAISSSLIDLHQQFDTLDIHRVSFQLRMLDALAGNKSLLLQYQDAFRAYQANQKQLASLREQSRTAQQELDFASFQLQELHEAGLQESEQEEMEQELAQLSNAEDIKRITGGIYQHLEESEQSVVAQLEEMLLNLGNLKDVHAGLGTLHQRFSGIVVELQDLAKELEALSENTEYDGARIQEVQSRLDSLYRLQNKHQVQSVADLLEIQEALEQKVNGIGDLSETIAKLEARIAQQETKLEELAAKLSQRRKGVIAGFEEKVMHQLAQMAMEHARLEVQVREEEVLTATGKDAVEFLFAANRGGRLQSIKEVASGGELSRLTLVTKSLVASAIPLPTLIFDEIDTGISGHVALKMGTILRNLSNQHQVVSITHSPQVAAMADAHYFVYKKDKEDRTITKVKLLQQEDRIRAIATMLSQNPPSNSALENARELLFTKPT